MKAVQSYQANDGKLFVDKTDCLKHDFDLAVRGFIQTHGPSGKSNMVQVSDVGSLVSKNFDKLYEMMKRQKQLLVAAAPRPAKAITLVTD